MPTGLYALDYYAHTGDLSAAAKYVPIATHALDFYISHYHNRTADGKLVIWPTQVRRCQCILKARVRPGVRRHRVCARAA